MAKYTFRVHRFNLSEAEAHELNTENQYLVEVVEADTVAEAMASLRVKHGDENQARIFLKKVD